jgi:prephenate dehydrogenase
MKNASDLSRGTLALSPITLIGSRGTMGTWLTTILRDHGLAVFEVDRDTDATVRVQAVRDARVIIFAVPISATVDVVHATLPLVAP